MPLVVFFEATGETVSLTFEQVLYESQTLIEHVYFPNYGVVSLLTILEDGTAAEVSLVGSEGIVGLPVFLGVDITPLKSIVQVPGDALRMQADVFKEFVNQLPHSTACYCTLPMH